MNDILALLFRRWRMGYAAVHGGREIFYRLHHDVPETSATGEQRTFHLRRGEVLRLTKTSLTKHVEVRQGSVWITGTPPKGDVILQAGDGLELNRDWPFVLAPLADAEIRLFN